MLKLFKTLAKDYWNSLNGYSEDAAAAWEEGDKLYFFKCFGKMIIMVLVPAGSVVFLLYILYTKRNAILALAVPPAVIALLIASYFEDIQPPPPPPPPPKTIELVRSRAKGAYHSMAQSAFLIFTEACHYLPGLVPPFSLSSVEAPTRFTITSNFITIYHFLLAKGAEDTSVGTIKEILDSIIGQHLQTQSLPLSVPAIYTTEAGETYPGLVCDGVYDCGQHYKVDLVITNEAEAAHLKAQEISKLGDGSIKFSAPHDPDFD